jgi:hypothetical protein
VAYLIKDAASGAGPVGADEPNDALDARRPFLNDDIDDDDDDDLPLPPDEVANKVGGGGGKRLFTKSAEKASVAA